PPARCTGRRFPPPRPRRALYRPSPEPEGNIVPPLFLSCVCPFPGNIKQSPEPAAPVLHTAKSAPLSLPPAVSYAGEAPGVTAAVFRVFQELLKSELIREIRLQFPNGNPHLLHGIPVPDGNGPVCLGVEIVGNTVGGTDLILTAVALADIPTVVIFAV